MSSLFEKNRIAIEKLNPALADQLKQTAEKGVELNFDNKQWELFCLTSPTSKVPYYSQQSQAQSSEELKAKVFSNPRILIFLGMGLGSHILDWIKKPHPLTQQIIIIEPFAPIFKKALETADFSPLLASKSCHIFLGSDQNALATFLGHFFSDNRYLSMANAVEYHTLKDAQQLTPQFFTEIPSIVNQAIAHQFNRQFGDPFDAFIGTQNFISNLSLLQNMPALDEAKNLFENKPGIVIASGPSLTHSLPFLKEVGNKAVMAVCPSALPAVLDQGIEPHIWLNIERLENQGAFLEKLPVKPPHVFVAPLLVHNRCFSGNGGFNAYILGKTLQSDWLKTPYPTVDLGHSSAHAAFLILTRLGCNPIYLVGQDLCYNADQSHAKGTWDESQKMISHTDASSKKYFEVLGNSGQKVRVNIFWNTYLKTFAERLIPESHTEVYNVIPQNMGALIPGAQRIDPAELNQKLTAPFPILNPLIETLSRPQTKAWVDKINPRLLNVKKMLQHLATEAQTMALECKIFQFSEAVISGDWGKAKPEYDAFMKKVMTYSSRYRLDTSKKDERDDYEHFFHSLVQGLFLQHRLEYFGRSGEEKGDLKEISRKSEILFHMSKDESFWAGALENLISKHL